MRLRTLARLIVPLSCVALFVPALASARITAATTGLSASGQAAGLTTACAANMDATSCIATLLGRVLNVLFGFLGIVLLGYILYAGFSWMTASSSKDVDQARNTIKNAVIGMLIIMASFSITGFALDQLKQVFGTTGSTTSAGAGTGTGSDASLNALMEGATRLCCFAGQTPMVDCTNACVHTPTTFSLPATATQDDCVAACGARICPGSPPTPVAGQAICSAAGTPPAPPAGAPSAADAHRTMCQDILNTAGHIDPSAQGNLCLECENQCLNYLCGGGTDPFVSAVTNVHKTDFSTPDELNNVRAECHARVCGSQCLGY